MILSAIRAAWASIQDTRPFSRARVEDFDMSQDGSSAWHHLDRQFMGCPVHVRRHNRGLEIRFEHTHAGTVAVGAAATARADEQGNMSTADAEHVSDMLYNLSDWLANTERRHGAASSNMAGALIAILFSPHRAEMIIDRAVAIAHPEQVEQEPVEAMDHEPGDTIPTTTMDVSLGGIDMAEGFPEVDVAREAFDRLSGRIARDIEGRFMATTVVPHRVVDQVTLQYRINGGDWVDVDHTNAPVNSMHEELLNITAGDIFTVGADRYVACHALEISRASLQTMLNQVITWRARAVDNNIQAPIEVRMSDRDVDGPPRGPTAVVPSKRKRRLEL